MHDLPVKWCTVLPIVQLFVDILKIIIVQQQPYVITIYITVQYVQIVSEINNHCLTLPFWLWKRLTKNLSNSNVKF